MKKFNKKNNKLSFLMLLFIAILGTVNESFAQQDAQYTNYMYNTIAVNPGYAGTREVLSIFGLHRTQWVGLDGAPVTNNFSLHTPIKNSNLGLGLSFVNDRIGPADENTISVDVAYRLLLNNSTLSFGLKGTANLLNVDYTKLSIYDGSDVEFQNNVDNRFSPNIGAGAYWYTDKYYLGLSVPNFLETKHYDDNSGGTTAKERMHYYFMGGYVFNLSPSFKFKPAFLTKLVSGTPLQVDLTANFMYNDKFILGGAYRWDAALSGLVGFQLTNKILIGYSYDLETSKLSNYNSGSHEIFVRFELFKNFNKVYSPRFF